MEKIRPRREKNEDDVSRNRWCHTDTNTHAPCHVDDGGWVFQSLRREKELTGNLWIPRFVHLLPRSRHSRRQRLDSFLGMMLGALELD